jgi:hypothetical protein
MRLPRRKRMQGKEDEGGRALAGAVLREYLGDLPRKELEREIEDIVEKELVKSRWEYKPEDCIPIYSCEPSSYPPLFTSNRNGIFC